MRVGFMGVGVALERNFTVGPVAVSVANETKKPGKQVDEIESDEKKRCLLPKVDGLVTEFHLGERPSRVEYKGEDGDGVEAMGRETTSMDEEWMHGVYFQQFICS